MYENDFRQNTWHSVFNTQEDIFIEYILEDGFLKYTITTIP